MRGPRLLALALLATLTLSGCTTPISTAEPVLTDVSPVPEGTSSPEHVAGEVIDEDTAEALNRGGQSQYRGYAMLDGTYIAVDRAAPTPSAVQEDANARAEEYAQEYPSVTEINTIPGQKALSEVTGGITRGTGKRVVMVVREEGYLEDGVTQNTNWYAVGGGMKPDGTIRTREQLQTAIDLQLTNKDRDEYLVVWPG